MYFRAVVTEAEGSTDGKNDGIVDGPNDAVTYGCIDGTVLSTGSSEKKGSSVKTGSSSSVCGSTDGIVGEDG